MLSCLGYFCVRADIYDTHVPIFSFQNLHTDDQLYVSGVCSVHIFITAVSLLLRPIFSLTGSRDLTITFRNSNIQSYPLLHWGLLNTILSSVEIVVSWIYALQVSVRYFTTDLAMIFRLWFVNGCTGVICEWLHSYYHIFKNALFFSVETSILKSQQRVAILWCFPFHKIICIANQFIPWYWADDSWW